MNLSIDEKIGQRFMFGVNSNNIDVIIELIKRTYIGGVVLYKKNYNSYSQMLDVIKRLKDANKNNKIPLFIAIDQEGGKVNRMPNDVHSFKNIYDVSRYDNKLVKEYARVNGKMLYNVGINMNLAPVVDVYNDSKSKVLYKRCFYGDEKQVSLLGKNYVSELKNHKVISVIKHFPGHGASKFDSHLLIPYIFNYQELLDRHMIPFKDIIHDGCDAIMVGHLVVRKLTNGLPASISAKFIKKYLRDGYNGLIITDELNMLKRHLFYRFIYMNKALTSDNDILLVKIKDFNEGYRIINKYKSILLSNQKYISNLDNNVMRIIDVKNKYMINGSINENTMGLDDINRKIDEFNDMIIKE